MGHLLLQHQLGRALPPLGGIPPCLLPRQTAGHSSVRQRFTEHRGKRRAVAGHAVCRVKLRLVQLRYNDGFLYSTADESECIFLCGDDYTVLRGSSTGQIMAPPLAEMSVTLYLPVAKAVSTGTNKPLMVSFIMDFSGKQQIDVKIR